MTPAMKFVSKHIAWGLLAVVASLLVLLVLAMFTHPFTAAVVVMVGGVIALVMVTMGAIAENIEVEDD